MVQKCTLKRGWDRRGGLGYKINYIRKCRFRLWMAQPYFTF